MSDGWVLYNAAHAGARIKSPDGEAWVRVLGFFAHKSTALSHAARLASDDAGLEVRIAPQAAFRVILRSSAATRELESAKHASLLSAHRARREHAHAEAATNAQTRQMGKLVFSAQERMAVYAEEAGAIAGSPKAAAAIDAPAAGVCGVQPVAPAHELRMQRFVALACIPDYEHADACDAQLAEWERRRDAEWTRLRNAFVAAALPCDAQLPDARTLLADWVENHPPAQGTNAWGQRVSESDVWQFVEGADVSADSEVRAWLRTRAAAYEEALWAWLGTKQPERASLLREWTAQNPMPAPSGAGEPAVAFLASAETEAQIRDWIQEHSASWRHHDIACVCMYEWLRVANVWSDELPRTYREPQMQRLHDAKQLQRREALQLAGRAKEIVIEGGAALALNV